MGAFFGLALVLRFALRLRPLAGAPSPGFARVALSVARSSAQVSGSPRGSPPRFKMHASHVARHCLASNPGSPR